MFGKNKIEKATWKDPHSSEEVKEGKILAVNLIWYTIQGEGPYAGEPAVFVRLAGCNLRCWFCDTEFDARTALRVEEVVRQVIEKAKDTTALVILTGGEPLRQQITPLCRELILAGYTVQIETAGTVWPPTMDSNPSLERMIRNRGVELVCSPKTPKVDPAIEQFCHHYKYVVKVGAVSAFDGLPSVSTQVSPDQDVRHDLFRTSDPAATIWVQPCDEYDADGIRNEKAYQANLNLVTSLSIIYGYRASIQLHKILGVD